MKPKKPKLSTPIGLPDQVDDLPTAPVDRGDETQDRFRYQWAMGVVLLAEGISGNSQSTSIWCEHHEDFLVELDTGNFVAIQIKTTSQENAKWKLSDEALIKSITRFCALEESCGANIDQYQFASNAPAYVPGPTTKSLAVLSSSPLRLTTVCSNAQSPSQINEPYKAAFNQLISSCSASEATMFKVLKKLIFRLGPPLRGYLDTLIAQVAPTLPQCFNLPNQRLQRVCEELMRLVETASGIPTGGIDGVLAYVASNGRPEVNIRGKCVTMDVARASVEQSRQISFRFVGVGSGLPLGQVQGQKNILHKKMQNAFLEGQFEPVWWRAISAEKRLIEKALADPEGFEQFATQLEGAVLTECKDIEALAALEPDVKKRGQLIYRDILQRLNHLAVNEPAMVEREPKETLIGVAGMLSGSCRFAWGVSLEGDGDGA